MFGLEKVDKNVTENRSKYVGGSDVPVILGLSKYKTQYELAKEKAGIVEPEFISNPYIQFGNQMEPEIRNYINTMNSLNFHPDTFIDKTIQFGPTWMGLTMKIKFCWKSKLMDLLQQ